MSVLAGMRNRAARVPQIPVGPEASADASWRGRAEGQAGEAPAEGSHRARPFTPPARSRCELAALAALLAVAAFVFFWNLTASGYANEFYAAAAQAGSQSWSAFLWGASDASGAITVDKPPASLWLMALSIRLLGLSSFALLLPQALMGVACIYLCYAIVRRRWGAAAGLGAGALFVATPVAALMFRFDNPDALLVLLMLGAAGCVLRALEAASDRAGNRVRTRWFVLAGILVGFGFLTKQLQVFLVLPGFGLAMLASSPARWPRRVLDAAAALAAMVVAAGWWVLLTVVVPSGSRPYIGGSQTDSFLELTFGYNGLGRLTGDETGSVVPGASSGGASQGGMWGETGIGRLLGSDFAGQFAWFALFALAGILICWLAARACSGAGGSAAGRARGRDAGQLGRLRRAFVLVFGGWLVVTWLVFSFMAGIFHAYYTVALVPAVAVMAAACLRSLWELRDRVWARPACAVLIGASALWACVIVVRSGAWTWLGWCVLALGAAGAVAVALAGVVPDARLRRRSTVAACTVAAAALLAAPAAWTAATIASGHHGSIVSAGPSSGAAGGPGGGGGGGGTAPGGTNASAPTAPDGAEADADAAGAGDAAAGEQANGSAGDGSSAPTPPSADGASGTGALSADADGTGSGEAADASETADTDAAAGSGPAAGGAAGAQAQGGSILGGSGASSNSELVELLVEGGSGYRWAAATTGSQNAAGYQLASELPVMAIGGFNGTDPAPTLEQFKAYVAAGLVRYYIAGGGMGGSQMGGSSAASEIEAWVEETFEAQTVGGVTVYDLAS